MKCPRLLCMLSLGALAGLMASCKEYAYYQSPFHTNASTYKTIPVKKDGEASSALYASAAISTGGANDRLKDGQAGFFGSVYKSHTGRLLQGYYGLMCGLGGYNVTKYQPDDPMGSPRYLSHQMDATVINERSGTKFFGGLGATAGINLVVPFRRSEWRLLGFEANWINEFGHYQRFRRKLPDTAANLISKYQNYLTLGFNTDMVFYTRRGSAGFKTAVYWFPQSSTLREGDLAPKQAIPAWFSQTVHVTKGKVTGSMQWNFGFHAASFQLGASYRIK